MEIAPRPFPPPKNNTKTETIIQFTKGYVLYSNHSFEKISFTPLPGPV